VGLASLIAVAQGKNAGNVSFEDKFLKEYNEAVKRQEERERQPVPADYFRPSSMYGCERMLYFMRAQEEQDQGGDEIKLIEICNSGTDRHTRIQNLVEDMQGVTCLDLEEVVKEANQKGVRTKFMGWNSDHTEARCKNDEMSIFFQPDGVINFMGKDVVLEIKTESTYQHSTRFEPKIDHKYQATCYGTGLGIDYVLFFYEDRNFCGKKPYLWKITDEMKDLVLSKVARVNKALTTGIAPEKEEGKCTYCRYKTACKKVDVAPPELVQEPQEIKVEKKKTVRRICGNCVHCGKEPIGAHYCGIDREGSMYVDRRKSCKFKPSRFKGGEQ